MIQDLFEKKSSLSFEVFPPKKDGEFEKAFEVLDANEVCSIIRDTNVASQNVAVRNNMVVVDRWTKHYRGVAMPHNRYVVNR